MHRILRNLTLAAVLTIGGAFGLSQTTAQAQGFGSCGGYDGASGGYGGGYPGGSGAFGGGYGGGGGYGAPCGNGIGIPSYNPNLPYSPAQQQGWREGRRFWETGIAPNHPLSPAEQSGFVAGERSEARMPWQLDPAKQQGFREGQIFWETGLLPDRPMSPAEQQGFRAGERRASAGGYLPW